MTKEPKDLLLLVWVHGFKGNEVTFESFPDRVSHLLRSTHPSLRLESRVFPAYQTRGELHAATLAFVDWLTMLVVELENDHGSGAGAGKAKIVLMGHSMGGLLIADAALDVAANTREADPMWPRIVALVAFDTPYLGLHPHTFKHSLTQAASYYEQARSIASTVTMLSPFAVGLGASVFGKKGQTEARPSNSRASTPPSAKGKETSTTTTESPSKSSWAIPAPSTKALYGFGAMALGAAAVGTAYYRREDFMNGWKFGYEHMTFVRNLWDEEGMRGRLVALDRLSRDRNVRFWNFYSHLPPSPPKELVSRTFAILPPTTHPLYPRFFPSSNTIATDEISAHMGMFNPRTDDGFYDLGLEVVRGLGERIEEEGVGRLGGEVDKGWEKGMMVGWREEKDEKGKMVWVEE